MVSFILDQLIVFLGSSVSSISAVLTIVLILALGFFFDFLMGGFRWKKMNGSKVLHNR